MARVQYKISLTLAQLAYIETKAAAIGITMSHYIAKLVERDMNGEIVVGNQLITPQRKIDPNNINDIGEPLTWETVLYPLGNRKYERLIVKHGDRFFSNMSQTYITDAQVAQFVQAAQNEVEWIKRNR